MGVDPGHKRIGIALSDISGNFPKPLCILEHESRKTDARNIVNLAIKQGVEKIVMGISLDENNQPTPIGENALRLADEVRSQTNLPVILWDEFETTRLAKKTLIEMGVKRNKRKGHHDDMAAAILLQSFIESIIEEIN